DLSVAFDDLRLDLAHLLIDQRRNVSLTGQYLLARLNDTVRAKRIRLPRESQRRLRLLPRFQYRLVRPLRRKRRVRLKLVNRLYRLKNAARGIRQPLLKMLYRSHYYNISTLESVPLKLVLSARGKERGIILIKV